MMTSLLLGAALTAPGAPIPTAADPAPTGPAPWVLYLKADDNGRAQVMIYKTQKVTQSRSVAEMVDGKVVNKIVQEQVERMLQTYVLVDTMNPKFITAAGTPLTADSVMKRAKTGLVVLVSADGKPISKSWLRTVDSEAVVVAADGLVSEAAPRGMGAIPTAAPRLVLLNTDMQGKVQVAYNPNSTNNNGMYYGGRGGRIAFMGNGQQVFFDDVSGGYYPNPTPQNTEAPIKALEEIAFEAYDLTGKAVTKEAALKRMTAGGYALIAGDNRMPDESYLKQFRGDLLILVSSELINVPTGKKGSGTATPAIAPVVRPGLMVKPAILQAVPLKVAPAPAPAPVPALPLKVVPAQAVPLKAVPAQALPLKVAPAPVLEREALPAPVAEKK